MLNNIFNKFEKSKSNYNTNLTNKSNNELLIYSENINISNNNLYYEYPNLTNNNNNLYNYQDIIK